MRAGQLWAHRRTLGTALWVWKVKYRGPKYWRVRATLVNRHNKAVYETSTYRIAVAELGNWRRIE